MKGVFHPLPKGYDDVLLKFDAGDKQMYSKKHSVELCTHSFTFKVSPNGVVSSDDRVVVGAPAQDEPAEQKVLFQVDNQRDRVALKKRNEERKSAGEL